MAVLTLSEFPRGAFVPANGVQSEVNISNWVSAYQTPLGFEIATNRYAPVSVNSTVSIKGTGLSISPVDAGLNDSIPLSQRTATGTITEFTFNVANSTFRGTVPQFTITGLNLSADAFLRNSTNITAFALSGNDTLFGNSGNNVLNGYAGNDVIFGYDGNDTLIGGDGNDTLDGGQGADSLFGGNGNDVLLSGVNPLVLGFELADGGAGNDTISFAGSIFNISINLQSGLTSAISSNTSNPQTVGNVTLVSIENAIGGNGDDILVGNAGVNVLSGGVGNDWLYGGAGADVLDGGAGFDFARYDNATGAVYARLDGVAGSSGDAIGDRFISIEGLVGSSFNDTLVGNNFNNDYLLGLGGNDGLYGLGGNDTIEGGAGNDTLFGGAGNDTLGGGTGNDGLFGEAGNDVIYGGEGNDYIEGGDGSDVLWGQSGNDQVIAGAGNDFAVLGEGDDFFRLGLDDDRLRFDYGNGRDTVADFNFGNDVIDFTFTDMTRAVLLNNAVETTQGVLLNLGSGSILLAGLTWGQVDWNGSSDFIFT